MTKPQGREAELWDAVKDHFAVDDRSLPEIQLVDLPPGSHQRLFDLLRERSRPLGRDQTFWHDEREQELPVVETPDLPTLVEAERVPSFHVLLREPRQRGVRLPDLGVFMEPDSLALDYRMGPEWSAETVAALAELLGDLLAVAPGARLSLEEAMDDSVTARFVEAVSTYLAGASP